MKHARLTYRSSFGDYGCAVDFRDDFTEKCAFRNKLGKFEDAYEWNPVAKVGLPEKEDSYYVTVQDPSGLTEDVVFQDEFYNGKFSLESVGYKVIAWVNILVPEPYKEEE